MENIEYRIGAAERELLRAETDNERAVAQAKLQAALMEKDRLDND